MPYYYPGYQYMGNMAGITTPVNQMQQNIPQVQQQQQPTNGLNWVQGESGAKSFLVAPNNTVLLMDSESEVFYIKSADASGMPLPLRIFEYKELAGGTSVPKEKVSDFVTRQEYEELKEKYNQIVNYLKDGGNANAKQTLSTDAQRYEQREKSSIYDERDISIREPEQKHESERLREQPSFFR